MPTSSQNDPFLTSPSGEPEDIFSDTVSTPIPGLDPAPVLAQPVAEEAMLPLPKSRKSHRRWLLIATIVLALILLAGAGFALWLWLQGLAKPSSNPTNLTNTVNTPVNPANTNTVNTNTVNTNTNVVNVPTTPVNTNSNNTNQSFVDVDHDGLSDEEELAVNTNPKKKDTDEDGLSDREEVRVYNTDPRNPDTDNDGYTDGDEVTHFYHPNSPDPKKRLFDLPQ